MRDRWSRDIGALVEALRRACHRPGVGGHPAAHGECSRAGRRFGEPYIRVTATAVVRADDESRSERELRQLGVVDGRSAAQSEIRLVEASCDAAWQRGDIAGLIACLTADAILVTHVERWRGATTRSGKSSAAFLAHGARGSGHHSEIQRIDVVTVDVAVVDGEVHIVGLPRRDAEAAASVTHAFSDVLLKRHERWAIAHVRAYDRQPPPLGRG